MIIDLYVVMVCLAFFMKHTQNILAKSGVVASKWVAWRVEHAQTHRINIRVGYMEMRI